MTAFGAHRIAFWVLCAVLLGTSFLLVERWHGHLDYARRALAGIGIAAGAGSFWAMSLARGAVVFWRSAVLWWCLAFLALAWLSLARALDRFEGFQIALQWSIAFVLMMVLVPLLRPAGRIVQLYRVLALIAFGTALVGLLQTHCGWNPFSVSAVAGSVFGNQNWAASVVNLALGPVVFLLCMAGGRAGWAAWSLVLGLCGGYLVHTQTRAVFLGVAVQAVVLAVVAIRGREADSARPFLTRRNAAGVAVALLLAALLGVTDVNGWRGREAGPAPSARVEPAEPPEHALDINIRSRLASYENTLLLIAAHPLAGVGVGNLGVRLAETSPRNHEYLFGDLFIEWTRTHNDWLQLWAELGLLFPILVAAAVILAWSRRRGLARVETEDRAPVLFSIAAGAGCAVDMLFSFPLYLAMPPLLLAAHAAVIERAGLAAGWPGSSWVPFRPRRVAAVAVAAVAVLALGAQAVLARRQFAAEAARIEAGIAEREDRLDDVLRLAPEVGRHQPWRSDWRVMESAAAVRLAIESSRGRTDPAHREGLLRRAEASLRRHLEREPNRAYARYLLGVCLGGLGRAGEAETEFTRALAARPGHADILWERARLRGQAGRGPEAIEDLLAFQAAQRDPAAAARADGWLALLLFQHGRHAEAVVPLERLVRAGVAPGRHREMLGIGLLHLPSRAEEGAALLRALYQGEPARTPHRELGERLLRDHELGAARAAGGVSRTD